MVDVFQIHLHPLIKPDIAAAIDLPQTGDSWLHAEAAFVPLAVDAFYIPHGQGSWADQAHLALEDVEELWKLVQAVTPEKSPDVCHARIIFDFEHRTVGLI